MIVRYLRSFLSLLFCIYVLLFLLYFVLSAKQIIQYFGKKNIYIFDYRFSSERFIVPVCAAQRLGNTAARNITAVASRRRHCADLTDPGVDP